MFNSKIWVKAISTLIILFFMCAVSIAQDQNLHKTKNLVSLDYKDAQLSEVFKDISRQTGTGFILDKDIRNLRLTIFVKDVTFEDAISAICATVNLKYETINKQTYSFRSK